MTNARIGLAISVLREEHDLTQQQLATRLHTTASAVSKIERGLFDTRLQTFEKLGRAFGLEAWELLRFASRLQETIDTRHDSEPRLHLANWREA